MLSKKPEIEMSGVQRAYHQLPQAEAPKPLSALALSQTFRPKESGLIKYEVWIGTITPTDMYANSDRSSEGPGRPSWGSPFNVEG